MKLVANVGGRPLISRTIGSLFAAGIDDVVVVVSPSADPALLELLRNERVTVAVNPEPDRGMFSSIQAGLSAAEGNPVVVLPADMPFVEGRTVRAVTDLCRTTGRAVVATKGGRRGHPIAFARPVRDAVVNADPAGTLKGALHEAGADPMELAVDDAGVLRDVDVPQDLSSGGDGESG